MKTIDFETHFTTQGWIDALYANPGYPRFAHDEHTKNRRLFYFEGAGEPYGDVVIEKLLDLGDGRLAAIDAAGIDVAVISLTSPGIERFETGLSVRLAREAKDTLAAACLGASRPLPRLCCPARGGRRRFGARVGAFGEGVGTRRLEDPLQLR